MVDVTNALLLERCRQQKRRGLDELQAICNSACGFGLAKTTFPKKDQKMPIYQYAPDSAQCETCSGHFDVIQKMSELALARCPTCGMAVHREMYTMAIAASSQIEPRCPQHQFRRAARSLPRAVRRLGGGGRRCFIGGNHLRHLECEGLSVVDAHNLHADFGSTDFLASRGESAGEDDNRHLVSLLTDKIKFANVIVVKKTALVDSTRLAQFHAVIRALNPKARVVESVRGEIPLAHIFNTRLFNLQDAYDIPGWVQELDGKHIPESETYLVYRAREPVVRWWAASPKSRWPEDGELRDPFPSWQQTETQQEALA